jgi:HAD superfamily hydrolase (TIGR01490 family)
MKLALFDFDGTITTHDTLFRFVRFYKGNFKLILGILILSPLFLLFKLKLIKNYKAKEYFLKYFFNGNSEQLFKKLAKEFSLNYIDKIIRKEAVEKIEWHKKQKHRIIVVSASIDYWLKPWCDKNDLELIATKIEVIDSIITGKLLTKNCYGKEKANRLKEIIDFANYTEIYAYGDSNGDKEMLELADNNKRYYKCF